MVLHLEQKILELQGELEQVHNLANMSLILNVPNINHQNTTTQDPPQPQNLELQDSTESSYHSMVPKAHTSKKSESSTITSSPITPPQQLNTQKPSLTALLKMCHNPPMFHPKHSSMIIHIPKLQVPTEAISYT